MIWFQLSWNGNKDGALETNENHYQCIYAFKDLNKYVVQYHNFLELIMTYKGFIFILKFDSLFYYFLGIKQRFFTTFYSQTDDQNKKENILIEAYFYIFVNFEQNYWAKL